jgi:RNA polymerase sigma-70 factor (ECF subfamily)
MRRLGVMEQDISDLLQDVYLIVHRKLDGFEQRSSAKTWVYRIALRTARDHFKKAHRRHEQSPEDTGTFRAEATQESRLHLHERCELLDSLLANINSKKREVFVLSEIEELSMQDVAVAVNIPIKTAYARLYAAKKEIKAALQRENRKNGAGYED